MQRTHSNLLTRFDMIVANKLHDLVVWLNRRGLVNHLSAIRLKNCANTPLVGLLDRCFPRISVSTDLQSLKTFIDLVVFRAISDSKPFRTDLPVLLVSYTKGEP